MLAKFLNVSSIWYFLGKYNIQGWESQRPKCHIFCMALTSLLAISIETVFRLWLCTWLFLSRVQSQRSLGQLALSFLLQVKECRQFPCGFPAQKSQPGKRWPYGRSILQIMVKVAWKEQTGRGPRRKRGLENLRKCAFSPLLTATGV